MIRARWFSAEWQITMRALAARMRTRAFTDQTTDGFLLERSREDHIEGRYIEKLSYQETIPDPFGQELTFDRITYRQVQFTLYREFPQLELRDAPRGTQAFMSRLLELTDFSISTAPLTVDLMQWAEIVRTQLDTHVAMDTVHLSDVNIAPAITGSMILRSDKDVRQSLRAITNGRTYTVDKVRLTWNEPPRTIAIHLGNTGSVKLDDADVHLLPTLRSALPKLQR